MLDGVNVRPLSGVAPLQIEEHFYFKGQEIEELEASSFCNREVSLLICTRPKMCF